MDAFKKIFTVFDVRAWVRAGVPLLAPNTLEQHAEPDETDRTSANSGMKAMKRPEGNEFDHRIKEARAEALEEEINEVTMLLAGWSLNDGVVEEIQRQAGENKDMGDVCDDEDFFGEWRPTMVFKLTQVNHAESKQENTDENMEQSMGDECNKLAEFPGEWTPGMAGQEYEKIKESGREQGGKELQEKQLHIEFDNLAELLMRWNSEVEGTKREQQEHGRKAETKELTTKDHPLQKKRKMNENLKKPSQEWSRQGLGLKMTQEQYPERCLRDGKHVHEYLSKGDEGIYCTWHSHRVFRTVQLTMISKVGLEVPDTPPKRRRQRQMVPLPLPSLELALETEAAGMCLSVSILS